MHKVLLLLVGLGLMGCSSRVDRMIGPQPDSTTSISPLNAVNRATIRWPAGDWSANVAWEARHAMSNRHDGMSNWPVPGDAYGPRWLADRCYTGSWWGEANDPNALPKAVAESFGYVGTVGHEAGGSHHYSGWCTFFVRYVLYRSSYGLNNGYHLTMPNFGQGSLYAWCTPAYMTNNFSQARPGWIGLRPPPNEHSLILDQRAIVNGRDGWWVIDGNYVAPWLIGRHFMPISTLNLSYWAWQPTLATSN